MHSEESLKNLFELFPTVSEIFFSSFHVNNPLFEFDKYKLNETHIKTLMTICFNPDSPMKLISEKVALEKGSFTPVANKLFELGFIEKIQFEDDKRKVFLRLTPKGVDFTEQIRANHLVHINTQLAKLSQNEQDLYFASLQMLITLSNKIKEV